MMTNFIASERLHEFASRVFQHFGIPPQDAEQAADILVLSDLRGIDSHGIARLRSYVGMLSIAITAATKVIAWARWSICCAAP